MFLVHPKYKGKTFLGEGKVLPLDIATQQDLEDLYLLGYHKIVFIDAEKISNKGNGSNEFIRTKATKGRNKGSAGTD